MRPEKPNYLSLEPTNKFKTNIKITRIIKIIKSSLMILSIFHNTPDLLFIT